MDDDSTMPIREFGASGKGLGATFTEIEQAVADRTDRPRKVEVGWWTLSALKKLGEQRRDEEDAMSLFRGILPAEAEVMRDIVREPVPVWVDPNLAPGVIRVYWIEDTTDRLAQVAEGTAVGDTPQEEGA
jgi:hypothetical protein